MELCEVLGTGVDGSLGGYSGFLGSLAPDTTVHGFSDEKTVESYLPDPDNLTFYYFYIFYLCSLFSFFLFLGDNY